MSADSRLVDIANSLLTNLADGLTTAGIDVPSRQYIHSGEVAHDVTEDECSGALVVTFQGLIQGTNELTATFIPGTPIKCAVPLIAQFDVVLLRCVPSINDDGKPPTADELAVAATGILYDSMTLPAVAISKELAGDLTNQHCSLKSIGNVNAVGPTGGIGGCVLTLFVDLT